MCVIAPKPCSMDCEFFYKSKNFVKEFGFSQLKMKCIRGQQVVVADVVVIAASFTTSAQAKICHNCSSCAQINDPSCLSGGAST